MILIYLWIIIYANGTYYGTASYFAGPTQLNWWKSKTYCTQNVSGELASIHSPEEYEQARTKCNEAVAGTTDDGGCWIGLNMNTVVNSTRIWRWSDDTDTDYGFINNNPTTGTSPWGSGEPNNVNNQNEFCVQFYYKNSNKNDLQWNDAECVWSIYPLCKIITPNPTKIQTTSPTSLPTTFNPTIHPSTDPTQHPASSASLIHTKVPTANPTQHLTSSPSQQPTLPPTANPLSGHTTATERATTTTEQMTSDTQITIEHHSTESLP
eukprot:781716_1